MKKFAVKVIAVLGILLMGSQSVFASANSNTVATKVDGVIVVTAESQMLYVEMGRFFREYNAQILSELTSADVNLANTQELLDLVRIENLKWVSSFRVARVSK